MGAPFPAELDRVVADIRSCIAFVETRAINRTDVIKKIFCALLTREHVLLQARTGVGKSLLCNQVYAMFSGAEIFQVQASKEQQPDTYFGALDLEELKQGRIVHNTEGSLVESHFGFIDEIFDANDYTLRALLTLLNERRLVRGTQNVAAPIHTVVAATNYLRVSEITEAVLDRFLYKAVIEPDRGPFFMYRISQQYVMHRGGIAIPERRVPYGDLARLAAVVTGQDKDIQVLVPPEIMFFANLVLRHYEMLLRRSRRQKGQSGGGASEFYISPRTQAKALDALRAVAVMNRRLEVELDDVGKMHLLLCTAGVREEREVFQRAYESLRNHYTAQHAFDQLHDLLQLQDLLDRIWEDRSLLEKPLTSLETTPMKRSIAQWARDTLGLREPTSEHNRKLLLGYLDGIEPVTDEIRQLRQRLKDEVVELFREDTDWS